MRDVLLSEIAEIVDCEHKTAPTADLGQEYGYSIGTRDIKNGRIDYSAAKRVSGPTWEGWSKRAVVGAGDLILAREAPVGQVGFVTGEVPVCLGQRTVLIRPDKDGADSRYLHYRLLAPAAQNWMLARAEGSTVVHLNVSDVRQIPIPGLPPLEEQRQVAEVLGAADDLIETNQRLAARCHAMAHAAVESGCRTRASQVSVGDAATFENRRRIPLSAQERMAMPGPFPYYGATGQLDSVGEYLFDGVRVLVGEDGTVVNADGSPVVQLVWGKYWVNNHAHVLRGTGCSTALLRILMERSSVVGVVTGAVQAKLSMGNLRSVELLLPSDPAIDLAVADLALAEQGLLDEAAQVSATRDELLPLLMSGRVRPGEVGA